MIPAKEMQHGRLIRATVTELEDVLKKELNTSALRSEGRASGACISEGSTYSTDTGKVFVKVNRDSKARDMFDGEAASLDRISDMDVIRVPEPIKVVDIPSGGAAFIMENLEFVEYGNEGMTSSQGAELGKLVARLHLKNKELIEWERKGENCMHRGKTLKAVKEFGFDVTTYCGYIPHSSQWLPSWESFFARKLQDQVDLLPKEEADSVAELLTHVFRKLPHFFKGVDIVPALLHGDLWHGNVAMTTEGFVAFDAASFYGHAEYDLAVCYFHESFPQSFYDTYFSMIPKEKGHQKRMVLYDLYHSMNFWNHFGSVGNPKERVIGRLKTLVNMDF